MKTTIYTLLSCCCRADWQPIIKAVPCLCWGIIFLIVLYLLLKYIVRPCIVNCQENKMKEDAHKREKEWAEFETTKASTDDALKQQVKDLKVKISEQEEALKSEKYNKDLLEKQLKMYSGIFENLNVEIKPKEKK